MVYPAGTTLNELCAKGHQPHSLGVRTISTLYEGKSPLEPFSPHISSLIFPNYAFYNRLPSSVSPFRSANTIMFYMHIRLTYIPPHRYADLAFAVIQMYTQPTPSESKSPPQPNAQTFKRQPKDVTVIAPSLLDWDPIAASIRSAMCNWDHRFEAQVVLSFRTRGSRNRIGATEVTFMHWLLACQRRHWFRAVSLCFVSTCSFSALRRGRSIQHNVKCYF